VTLTTTGAGVLGAPHFFCEDGFIQFDQPQSVAINDGTVTLTLPVSDHVDRKTQKLLGVLAYIDVAGAYRGVQVDVPIR
jgi:hypothetical protein